jgi:hypothetical protein
MNVYFQLAWRNWMVTQLDAVETCYVGYPDFCQWINMMEVQNNIIGLPTATNIHFLLALCLPP